MNVRRPKFLDSQFVKLGNEGYELLPGAPDDVVREFEAYKATQRRATALESGPPMDIQRDSRSEEPT